MQNQNPLSTHFRQPSVYLKLPSGGRHWMADSINLPANGEIGIMPMTTRDEITLRTPDALMNGQGVVSVIQSCCPNITNAWSMPSIDLDAVLIAIRIATYGDEMDIDSVCPQCKHENRHKIGLGTVLTRVKSPDYSKTLTVDGLTIKFKPLNYFQSNKNNLINFEEEKIIQLITNEDIDPETRKAQFDIHLQKIVDINVNMLTQSTESIITEDGTAVTDSQFISEFYNNTSNKIIKMVQTKLKEITEVANIPPALVQCEGCEKDYKVELTFDYANFFGPPS